MKQNHTYTYIIATENEIEYINTLKITTTKQYIRGSENRKPYIQTVFQNAGFYHLTAHRMDHTAQNNSTLHQNTFLQIYNKYHVNIYCNKIVVLKKKVYSTVPYPDMARIANKTHLIIK